MYVNVGGRCTVMMMFVLILLVNGSQLGKLWRCGLCRKIAAGFINQNQIYPI